MVGLYTVVQRYYVDVLKERFYMQWSKVLRTKLMDSGNRTVLQKSKRDRT